MKRNADAKRLRTTTGLFIAALLLASCTPAGDSLAKKAANRAFVEAVNLQCRSTRAKIEIAGKIAKIASQTEKGKTVTGDAGERLATAKDRAQQLIDRVSALAGPSGLSDDLTNGFERLQSISNDIADGKLSKAEGLRQIEEARTQLRAKGFDDCA